MDGKRLIEKIRLRNILSFGDKGEEIELQPLNIIIGQNASGKSNFIDVIKLLRSLPDNKGLANFISKNGGIKEWIWKGNKSSDLTVIKADFKWLDTSAKYEILLSEKSQRVFIEDEKFYNANGIELFERNDVFGLTGEDESLLTNSVLNKNLSKAEFIYFRRLLSEFKIYSEFQTSRNSEIRRPEFADIPNDFLEENGLNLYLVLNALESLFDTKETILVNLQKFYSKVENYSLRIFGGTVQFYFHEKGLKSPISAFRLSDGTLRYLCLLAVLCHPEPPPLICIEEPETGLHPDILPTIAELMKEASKRTQLIVTTHSDILVSAFSDMPEAVMVCEKDEDGTHFKRLEADKLKLWLEEYTLGEVWMRGGIGGTRW
jgi:predicted ATPase